MVAQWGGCMAGGIRADTCTSHSGTSTLPVVTNSDTNSNIYSSNNATTTTNTTTNTATNSVSTSTTVHLNQTSAVRASSTDNIANCDPSKGALCRLQLEGHPSCITSSLLELAARDGYQDMMLLCEGRRVVAHKLVLSAASQYFKKILEDYTDPSPVVVIVEGVRWAAVALVLQYVYSGEAVVGAKDLVEFIAAGKALGVVGLKDFKGPMAGEEEEMETTDHGILDNESVKYPKTCSDLLDDQTYTSKESLQSTVFNTNKKRSLLLTETQNDAICMEKRPRTEACCIDSRESEEVDVNVEKEQLHEEEEEEEEEDEEEEEEIEVGSPLHVPPDHSLCTATTDYTSVNNLMLYSSTATSDNTRTIDSIDDAAFENVVIDKTSDNVAIDDTVDVMTIEKAGDTINTVVNRTNVNASVTDASVTITSVPSTSVTNASISNAVNISASFRKARRGSKVNIEKSGPGKDNFVDCSVMDQNISFNTEQQSASVSENYNQICEKSSNNGTHSNAYNHNCGSSKLPLSTYAIIQSSPDLPQAAIGTNLSNYDSNKVSATRQTPPGRLETFNCNRRTVATKRNLQRTFNGTNKVISNSPLAQLLNVTKKPISCLTSGLSSLLTTVDTVDTADNVNHLNDASRETLSGLLSAMTSERTLTQVHNGASTYFNGNGLNNLLVNNDNGANNGASTYFNGNGLNNLLVNHDMPSILSSVLPNLSNGDTTTINLSSTNDHASTSSDETDARTLFLSSLNTRNVLGQFTNNEMNSSTKEFSEKRNISPIKNFCNGFITTENSMNPTQKLLNNAFLSINCMANLKDGFIDGAKASEYNGTPLDAELSGINTTKSDYHNDIIDMESVETPGENSFIDVITRSDENSGHVKINDAPSPLSDPAGNREPRDTREAKQATEIQEATDIKEARKIKAAREEMEIREATGSRETQKVREAMEAKDTPGVREILETREVVEAKEVKEIREERQIREIREIKESMETNKTREVREASNPLVAVFPETVKQEGGNHVAVETTFATQEEIEAVLDQYQRKLAFHEPRPCPSCDRMYRDAATLRTHITIMHTPGPEQFVCSCTKTFTTKYAMHHHKKNGHYNPGTYSFK